MVSFCSNTKRIWVGAKSGGLALYEMKQHTKCQVTYNTWMGAKGKGGEEGRGAACQLSGITSG